MKLEFSRRILENSPNTKFHKYSSSGSRVVPCGRMGRQTDRRDEANGRFSQFCRLRDSVEKYGRARQATDDIIWRMRFACWITKATDTHSEYVILIAIPRQQWLHELASRLRYTYIVCLVI
jgi:hypothetical protein